MKDFRCIKLKVSGSTKADALMVTWLECANWLSKIVFKSGDINSNRLAKRYYAQLRKRGLTSQLACSVCKWVCATYKKARTKRKWTLSIYKKQTMPIVWKRDFNRLVDRAGKKNRVTLWAEQIVIDDPRPLPDYPWKDSLLKKVGDQWILILCYQIPPVAPKTYGSIVGVDFGVKRLMTATNSDNSKTFFFHGGELNHRRSCIRDTIASVQAVGTRSAHRLLKRLWGNDSAVTEHLLHVASKALIAYAVANGARKIVLEDLTNIRDSSLKKGKDMRSKIHRWPYFKGRFNITYKAYAVGIEVDIVSPTNTSRGCSRCGHVSASNRNRLKFKCKKCGYRQDADRNASINIRIRSVSIEHNSAGMGSVKSPESSEPSDIGSGSIVSDDDLVMN